MVIDLAILLKRRVIFISTFGVQVLDLVPVVCGDKYGTELLMIWLKLGCGLPAAYKETGKFIALRYDFGTPISKWYHIHIL